MTTVAFIGLGNMGGPMAANLAKVGFKVRAFDRCPQASTCAGFTWMVTRRCLK